MAMKLHFEPDLDYQLEAIEAVCDIFRGQEICRTEFTVTRDPADSQMRMGFAESDLGIGNRLTLLDEELLANVHDIQLRHGLKPSESLDSGDFTVEMETGTGKTYVYLRTIFELNKRYGFTKFVIVVPSIAIKEGVHKTLEITKEHFKGLYAGVPFDYFVYDSANLSPVRSFATSPHVQIMVLTVGAIVRFGNEVEAAMQDARTRPNTNVMYRPHEKTGGERPIALVRAALPVVIVDEPQSVDGGAQGQGRQALAKLNPLCTLRYSATHANKHHMVYRLDAVDAYDKKLVKQIEVAAATVEQAYNKPYVRLVSVQSRRNTVSATLELDMATRGGAVVRREVPVSDGDNLQQTTGRDVYANMRIGEIRAGKGERWMELRYPGGENFLQVGEAHGDVEPLSLQRELIRRTIREHLEKERRLRPQGIKVLTLFFIDEVARYRQYDADGNLVKGEYALIFEEEYRRAAKLPEFNTLFAEADVNTAAEEVHNGYFSIDKKGRVTDTAENNQTGRDNAERAYNLIMKDKERLLSFETSLKFIFSHSALREGWDNPNVFQICTLREIRTERERRQSIGRGLRLCVNQDGERVRGFDVNTLTVIANESYEDFAEKLQHEIEEETGIRFGIVEEHEFANVPVAGTDGETAPLGFEQSKALWSHLLAHEYINAAGKIQDKLRKALLEDTLELPDEFAAQRAQIKHTLVKRAGKLEVKNADHRHPVPSRQAMLESGEFRALWDRIKHKTTYRVQFDNEGLIGKCVEAVREAPAIPKVRLQWRKAGLSIGKAGVEAKENKNSANMVFLDEGDIELPDLLTELQDRTQLTRRTLFRVLSESTRLEDFRRNPQVFIDQTAYAINRCKRNFIVDGIRYLRLGDEEYFAQELFVEHELTGYLTNLVPSTKSVYESVVYDSGPERGFAEQLENDSTVKVYAKLPGWFTIPTPLGTYNPDWAVLIERDGAERLYLVVETKDTLFTDDLPDAQGSRIKCGRRHFEALAVGESPARYEVATSFEGLMARI
jgi:type III restriction enzyme